jgi:hypothetical protein
MFSVCFGGECGYRGCLIEKNESKLSVKSVDLRIPAFIQRINCGYVLFCWNKVPVG